jgi:hypothetical protein
MENSVFGKKTRQENELLDTNYREIIVFHLFVRPYIKGDRLFNLVVRVAGCRLRGPEINSRSCQILREAEALKREAS